MHVEYVCSVTLFKDLSIKEKSFTSIFPDQIMKNVSEYMLYTFSSDKHEKTKRKTKISGRHEIPLCYYISCSIEQR